jgi:dTDP-4-dehydrorhamnose reductase
VSITGVARVLVIGAGGMLGREVVRLLHEGKHEVVRTSRSPRPGWVRFDAELDPLGALCDAVDLVVNCAGVLSSEIDSEDASSVERAEIVNSHLPKSLAEQSPRLVHVSTDAVFDEAAGRCFEDDYRFATDVYGSTKRLGEPATQSALTLRCSFVGRDPVRRGGLLEWVLAQTGEVAGYTDQLWNGRTATQVASLIAALVSPSLFESARAEGPVHHVFEDPPLTKGELIALIARTFQHNVVVRPVNSGRPISRVLGTRYGVLREYLESVPPRGVSLEALANRECRK